MLYQYIYVVHSLWVFKGKENTHTTLTYTSKSPKKKRNMGLIWLIYLENKPWQGAWQLHSKPNNGNCQLQVEI
jgi:hypothetical protein